MNTFWPSLRPVLGAKHSTLVRENCICLCWSPFDSHWEDVERKADCARMSTQVNSQPIDILLHSLDGTEVFATDPEGTHCLGPFGVFSIQPSIMPVIASDPSDSLSGISPDALDENRTNPIDISSFENGVEMLTEQQDLESDLFGNGLLTSTFDSGVLNSLFELTGCTPEEQPLQEDNETSTNANPHMQLLDLYLPFNSTPSLQFAGDFGDLASSTTNTLLVHYKENLISCFMSVEHHKPPWQILHLPCAVSAYGEIVSLGLLINSNILTETELRLTCRGYQSRQGISTFRHLRDERVESRPTPSRYGKAIAMACCWRAVSR